MLDVVVSNSSLNLSKRDADVAVRATNRAPDTSGGAAHRRFSGCAVYGLENGRDRVELSDLGRHNWVGLGENLAGIKIAKWLRDHVPSDRIVYRVNTVLGLAEAVESRYRSRLPARCAIGASTPGLVQLSDVVPDVGGDLWLLTHPDLRQTARVRAFMDYAGAELAKKRRLIEGGSEVRATEPA